MKILHHAVLVRSRAVMSVELPLDGSIEIRESSTAHFGIDDARELVRVSSQRPADSMEQCFVVRTGFITHEAQNALLKILEEPPGSTKFIFVVPPDFNFLPTLFSRFNEVDLQEMSVSMEEAEEFNKFIQATYANRLVSIEVAIKKKDIDWQRMMKQEIINYLSKNKLDTVSLCVLEYVARTLLTRGASNKMLLEQAAFTLPVR